MPISRIRKYLFVKDSLWISSALTLFLVANFINYENEKPILKLTKQDTATNFDSKVYLFTSAGNKRLITDILWVQTLIESDINHYKKKDLNNWLFLRFLTISILDPMFYENYLYGGQFLAIIKDDLEGASFLYEKAIQYFPDDYRLNYNAGFLNYFEIGNFEKGIKFLSKIEGHPSSPVFITSIIHKLKHASGASLNELFTMVMHNYQSTKDNGLKMRLSSDLYSIKAEIDLKCLNQGNHHCDKYDFYRDRYIFKDGKFYSKKYFMPFRIVRREDSGEPKPLKPINYFD